MTLRIHRIIERTRTEGPGLRFCIYVQGCSIRCAGCANQELWDFRGGYGVSVEYIKARIKKVVSQIDGITFLGGEPTCQAKALCQIAEFADTLGLSVLLFSGYYYEELLRSGNKYVQELLKHTDLLIDGPYEQGATTDKLPLAGSCNQRFHYLGKRISKEDVLSYNNAVEVRITTAGILEINGMGNIKRIKKLIMN